MSEGTKLDVLRSRLRFKSPTPSPIEKPQNGHLPRSASQGSQGTQGGIIRRMTTHLSSIIRPDKPLGAEPTWASSFSAVVKASWLNILLVFIPVSWALHFLWHDPSSKQDTIIFVFSFLAIIPLAKLLGFATEELAIRVGQTIGGLLNATLGNAVELIVAIIALTKCELTIVQSSLVGSILSNLLLVLGMCFFAGGTRFSEQGFLASAAQLNSSLLTLSVVAVLFPAAFHFAVTPSSTASPNSDPLENPKEGSDILKMSRGVSLILLFIYGGYLVFQLWSHSHLYSDAAADFKSTAYPDKKKDKEKDSLKTSGRTGTPSSLTSPGASGSHGNEDEPLVPSTTTGTTAVDPAVVANGTARQPDLEAAHSTEEEEEVEVPVLNVGASIVLLIAVTVLVAFTAEFLVDSINGMTDGTGISREWTGLILLPIVGNAAEHVTAVTVSVKDKLTLSLGVAVGSSIQIALFVIPLLTVIAWIMGKPLSLLFDPFESVALFLAVITVNYTVADGKSNWLEGMILMCLYVIIGTVFWFYPSNTALQQQLGLACPGVTLAG
ncbi:calcium/proton exchanger [Exidia glandulosa HHB12029]|uniref:Calcium/proton exchanger n=1 Tax=Exidia glandulosa HHB12029 TaxID=1314781 RepID=A0A165CUD6_EXIGL|nr:calcium/proton exchanger [Exidia glandulosa HHB12029]